MYDFKPTVLMILTFFISNVDQLLHTALLTVNFAYISYQFYSFHKNKNDKNKE